MGTVDEGLGDFFKQRKISKEHVVPDKTTQRENEINKEKSEDSGWVDVCLHVTLPSPWSSKSLSKFTIVSSSGGDFGG